jgi:hypothetical protein
MSDWQSRSAEASVMHMVIYFFTMLTTTTVYINLKKYNSSVIRLATYGQFVILQQKVGGTGHIFFQWQELDGNAGL